MKSRLICCSNVKTAKVVTSLRRRCRMPLFRMLFTNIRSSPKSLPPVTSSAVPSSNTFVESLGVSSHFTVDPAVVVEYLNRKKLEFKELDNRLCVRECPFCHETYNKPDNLFKLYVFKNNGGYFCHRCKAKGSWFDLKRNLGDLGGIESVAASLTNLSGPNLLSAKDPTYAVPDQSQVRSFVANLFTPRYSHVLEMLQKNSWAEKRSLGTVSGRRLRNKV